MVVVLTEIAIVALFATAFNLLMGYGGMVSFGHAAYFALGAYAAALVVKRGGPAHAGWASPPLPWWPRLARCSSASSSSA